MPNNYSTKCALPGRDAAYSIVVPAFQTLTVSVTPSTAWDPAILILSNCQAEALTCLANADAGNAGEVEVATFTNTTGANINVLVVIDSWSSVSAGPFSVVADVRP
jgi:hypothetical protein